MPIWKERPSLVHQHDWNDAYQKLSNRSACWVRRNMNLINHLQNPSKYGWFRSNGRAGRPNIKRVAQEQKVWIRKSPTPAQSWHPWADMVARLSRTLSLSVPDRPNTSTNEMTDPELDLWPRDLNRIAVSFNPKDLMIRQSIARRRVEDLA